MTPSEPPYSTELDFLKIDIDEKIGTITVAVMAANQIDPSVNVDTILNALEHRGVLHWDLQLQKIEAVVDALQKGIAGLFEVGFRRDASFSLSISPDKMKVVATITPAQGGQHFPAEQLLSSILKLGIHKNRVLQSALKQTLTADTHCEIDVALGLLPQAGIDTQFIELVSDQCPVEIEADSDQVIDFLAGRTYSNVTQGTPLLERIPAQPGKVGQDVFGNIVQPEHGIDLPFEFPFEGASISVDNANMVIADIDGHPIYMPGKVNVAPTLHLNNVDLSTGHVKFNGSVEVSGDVLPGLQIDASGDIFVKGVVERAILKSGANITVQGGIIGNRKQESTHESDLPIHDSTEVDADIDYLCVVNAVGELSIKYASEAKLIANNIYAKEYVFNCSINAQQGLYIGQHGGHGKISGGHITAGHCVIGKEIGSPSYQKTTIAIKQSDPEIIVKKLLFIQEKRTEQFLRLQQLLEALPADSAENPQVLEHQKAIKIQEAMADLNFILTDIQQRLINAEQAKFSEHTPFVQATHRSYPKCFISINSSALVTDEESRACTFTRKGQTIAITH